MTIYEQILAGLQTKFTGVDAATLNRIATKKADGVTDESQVKTIVDGVNFTDVLTNYGDARADTAAKTFKETYEKKYGIKDGKPIEQKPIDQPTPPTPTTPPVPTNAAEFAKLMQDGIAAAMKPITDKLTALENDKSESEFNARVSEAAKKYGISDGLVKMLNVPKDTPDLDKFMQDTKQSLTNVGFQEVKAPESAEQQIKSESESIAEQINKGTEDLVKTETK